MTGQFSLNHQMTKEKTKKCDRTIILENETYEENGLHTDKGMVRVTLRVRESRVPCSVWETVVTTYDFVPGELNFEPKIAWVDAKDIK